MGLFDKLKSIISKKEKIVEEVKEEYDVEDVNTIENVDEVEDYIQDDTIEEEVEEVSNEELEESSDEEETKMDDEKFDLEDDEEADFEKSDDEDEDDDWAQFVKEHQSDNKVEEAQEIFTYDKGLEKTRKEFVSKLSMLGIKYTKINEEYYEELEELLINADVGVNTVMNFMDKLRDRVKSEKITDANYLNEVIVDELFIIYVDNDSLSDKIQIYSLTDKTLVLYCHYNFID